MWLRENIELAVLRRTTARLRQLGSQLEASKAADMLDVPMSAFSGLAIL